MSDERFEHDIAGALLADDPGDVPGRLRARIAAIPDEAPRRDSRPMRALGLLAAAAVVIAAVAIAGLSHRGETVGLPASATPSSPIASASAQGLLPSPSASVSPSATPTPSATGSDGPITLDPSRLTGLMDGTFAIRDNVGYVRSMADTVSWPILLRLPYGTGQDAVMVELTNGHDIASYALTDAGLVWVETWYTQPAIDCTKLMPCSAHQGQPVSWSLNLTSLDKHTTRLDRGVVSRTSVGGEAAGPLPPEMAAQGGRVAYAVPRLHVAGAPEASTIVVRSLSDGTVVRRIDTQGYVAQLGVWGQALLFRMAIDAGSSAGTVDPGEATLSVVPSDTGTTSALGLHVGAATIGDGGVAGDVRVAWTLNDQNDGSVRVAALGDLKTTTIAPATPAGGPASQPVIVGDGVAWVVQVQDGAGAWSSAVDVWRPGWGRGRVVTSLGSPDVIGFTDGLLLAAGAGIPSDLTPAPEVGIPAAVLFGSP